MKGIVFQLLEEAVVRRAGADAWDGVLEAARVDGAYTSLGSYSDDELRQLVSAVSADFGSMPHAVLRWFGQQAIPVLAQRFPHFFAPHRNTRSFVLALNSIIHPEVRKLYPGAETPHFDWEEEPGGALRMGYKSSRRMCVFAQGMVEGAAGQFGEEAQVEHLLCVHRGDPDCLLRISFRPISAG